jgi:FAD/FMN-containing dehydrogenase
MSKVAEYLQEHIQGKVSINPGVLRAASKDGSVLSITPEMVIYPRVTNDLRKITRFAWQLAEKGHVLALTPRGSGTDQTGGAIGKGAVIVLPTYMNRIFELDAKQKLIRVQPGVDVVTLSNALALQGLGVPPLLSMTNGTVGGAVANNAHGVFSGRYGDVRDWTHQLEVVLSSGDVLQTSRLNKRELHKKKSLQTFEGEIYRTIDGLITENAEMIDQKLGGAAPDNVGYASIAKVKRKDGSFDLTPLFAGSQGTLGIISEMILKTEFISAHQGVAIATFASTEAARDAIDKLVGLEPSLLEYFDNALFTIAAAQGKLYEFYKNTPQPIQAVVLVGFNDFNERTNTKKLKKVVKLLSNSDIEVIIADNEDANELLAVRDVVSYLLSPSEKDLTAPALFDGVFIPPERFEEFTGAVGKLAAKHDVTLPIYSRELESILFTRPFLHLHKVGDKQKIFKLLDEFSQLVTQYGGQLIAQDGEGRVKAQFAYASLDDDVLALFESIKKAFDPYGILNPGVKQKTELRQLVSHLRTDFGDQATAHERPTY